MLFLVVAACNLSSLLNSMIEYSQNETLLPKSLNLNVSIILTPGLQFVIPRWCWEFRYKILVQKKGFTRSGLQRAA